MDHVSGMDRREPGAELRDDAQRHPPLQRPALALLHRLRQRLAAQKLHHQEMQRAVAVEIMHLHDIGVAQLEQAPPSRCSRMAASS